MTDLELEPNDKCVPSHEWLVGYVQLVTKDYPNDWVCAVINELLCTRRDVLTLKGQLPAPRGGAPSPQEAARERAQGQWAIINGLEERFGLAIGAGGCPGSLIYQAFECLQKRLQDAEAERDHAAEGLRVLTEKQHEYVAQAEARLTGGERAALEKIADYTELYAEDREPPRRPQIEEIRLIRRVVLDALARLSAPTTEEK